MAELTSGRPRESGSDEEMTPSSGENSTGVSGGAQRYESKVTIDDLPEEMMISIFSHLSARDKARAAEVCTTWRDLVDDPWLWREEKVKLHLGRLTSADMDSWKGRKLRHAVIEVTQRSEIANLKVFLSTVPSLRRLLIFSEYPFVLDDLKTAFSKDLPQMKEMTLCTKIDPQDMEYISKKTKNLEVLTTSSCVSCTFSTISRNLKKLKSLEFPTQLLHGCQGFHALSVCQLPSLLELHLSGCVRIGDSELRYLREGLANLEILSVWLSSQTTQAGMQYLQQMSSLRHLKLGQVPSGLSGWLGPLVRGLTQLRVLSLPDCPNITEADAKAVAQLRHLEHVYLGGIGDAHLEALSHSRGRIRILDVNFLSKATESGLKRISMLTELEELILGEGYAFDGALRHLSQGLPKLHKLTLICCGFISDEGCQCIAKMPSLKVIRIYYCQVSEVGRSYLRQSSANTFMQ